MIICLITVINYNGLLQLFTTILLISVYKHVGIQIILLLSYICTFLFIISKFNLQII